MVEQELNPHSEGSMEESLRGKDIESGSRFVHSLRKKKSLKTTNAYFYWITREQGSFDWFKGVMNEIAEMDQKVGILIESVSSFLKTRIN